MIEDKTFSIHDCSFGIWRDVPSVRKPLSLADFIAKQGKRLTEREKDQERIEARRISDEEEQLRKEVFGETREFYDEIRMFMMNSGWTFHQDPRVKKHYRSIANNHHRGKRNDVHFISSCSGRHIEVKFFEDVARENQYGGQYTNDKLKKMPYLRRLRTIVAIRQLRDFLLANGYTETSKVYPAEGYASVMQHRAELEDFQGKDFYARERQAYNCTDADKIEMHDGDVRYFWHWRGYIQRGVVYRNINNMWWVVTGPYSYHNAANFELFTWNPAMGRRRKLSPEKIRKIIGEKLAKAIEQQKFERAIILRDLISKIAA